VIEAASSAPTSSADGPSEAGAGKGAAADPTNALFAMLLAGMVAPAPTGQTPVPKGGKGEAAEPASEPKDVPVATPPTGPLLPAADATLLVATAAAGTGTGTGAAGQAVPAAAEEKGLPLAPDLLAPASGSPTPIVEKGTGKKHTLGTAGTTADGARTHRGHRAEEAPTTEATTAAPATQAPPATPAPTAATTTDGQTSTGQGDGHGQQPQQQQARQEAPQQGDVQAPALPNVTTTTAATAHTGQLQMPAPAAAAPAAGPAQQNPVVPFTQDHARFEHLVEGLGAKLHVSRAEGGSALRMTLRPEELGQVTVRLQVGADGVTTASVTADTQQAASLLAGAADDLRKALADRGLQLDKLDVSSGGTGGTTGDPRADSQQSNQTSRDGNAPRSFYSFRAETEAAVTASAVDAREGETGHSYLA
jgi:flagellar hook-length control protein FliK